MQQVEMVVAAVAALMAAVAERELMVLVLQIHLIMVVMLLNIHKLQIIISQ